MSKSDWKKLIESKVVEDKLTELCNIVRSYGVTADEFLECFNKPLEPIRITSDIQKLLFRFVGDDNFEGLLKQPTYKDLNSWGGRPVEIID